MSVRIGSLCSGFGGLDHAVMAVFGGSLAWVSDIDPGACKVLAHRYPDVPNLGDMTAVDWASVEPVDVLCGGTPCQDLSHAGSRAGMSEGTHSNLWAAMREAIAQLRPSVVVWENVRGAYSARADSAVEPCPGCVGDEPGVSLRALGRVVGDLAELGYDARWHGLRAADVGAPHGRHRVFLVATDSRGEHGEQRWVAAPGQAPSGRALGELAGRGRASAGLTLPTFTTRDHKGRNQRDDASCLTGALLPTPRATDGTNGGPNQRGSSGDLMPPSAVALLPTPTAQDSAASGGDPATGNVTLTDAVVRGRVDWGDYASAIARWGAILGREAPPPTEPAPKGGRRLSPRFTEWMLGMPEGWVTDVPGVTRNEALRLCGNGVVSLQAEAALREMLAWAVAA